MSDYREQVIFMKIKRRKVEEMFSPVETITEERKLFMKFEEVLIKLMLLVFVMTWLMFMQIFWILFRKWLKSNPARQTVRGLSDFMAN